MFLVTTMTRLRNNRSTSFLNNLIQGPSREQDSASHMIKQRNRVNKNFVQIYLLQNMKIHIISLNTIDEKENKL